LQKPTALRQVTDTYFDLARGGHDLDRGPTESDDSSKFEAIHAARHLYVGKHDRDIQAAFQNYNGLFRIPRFDDFKGFFDHFNGVHPDQQFVFDDKDNRAFRF